MRRAGLAQEALRPYQVVGDAIPESLTGAPGDPARGRAIVVKREGLACCATPAHFRRSGSRAIWRPNLKGTGARWSEGELRLRMVDATRLNPATIMPSYYRIDGLTRVAPAFRGKPVLTRRADRGRGGVSEDAEEIEMHENLITVSDNPRADSWPRPAARARR